jgi:c-di-AMP phosphodiesterase-like protein
MSKIPPHIVDEVMQTARIEEVIGEFVSLKRAGSNLKGLSPFTDEKTPSFVVSPAKQIFKCFSTGKGGTVVTFIMEKVLKMRPKVRNKLQQPQNARVYSSSTSLQKNILKIAYTTRKKEMQSPYPTSRSAALERISFKNFNSVTA